MRSESNRVGANPRCWLSPSGLLSPGFPVSDRWPLPGTQSLSGPQSITRPTGLPQRQPVPGTEAELPNACLPGTDTADIQPVDCTAESRLWNLSGEAW